MLTVLNQLPGGFLECSAKELHEILQGPALIHLHGRREPALFVSILLHGNEDTGLLAMQAVLRKYQDGELPRALSLFVGNVTAAKQGARRLEGQPDYNRVWPGSVEPASPEHDMMGEVVNIMSRRGVFASIDIHNNTGLNPHYACVNKLDDTSLHLATMFSRIVVYFTEPRGVQSAAFTPLCPSVTLECGKPGGAGGIEHAASFVEGAMHLSAFPDHPVARHDLDLFHTVAVVKVPEQYSLSVGQPGADLCLDENIDHLNFRELPAGTALGKVNLGTGIPLSALDTRDKELNDYYFMVRDGMLYTRHAVMPAMLTRDTNIIRQDCLCYLMDRLEIKNKNEK